MQTETNPTLPAATHAADETQHDFDFPQREAAFFYGLFLRGHSAEELRREAEYERMYRLGYEPKRICRPVYRPLTMPFSFDGSLASLESSMEYIEEIEWVPRRRNDMADAMAMMRRVPLTIDKSTLRQLESMTPKHRRNV